MYYFYSEYRFLIKTNKGIP